MDFDSPETNYCANDQCKNFGYYVLFFFFYSLYILYIYISCVSGFSLADRMIKSKFKKKKKKQLCRNSFWPDTTHGMELCHCLSVEQGFFYFFKASILQDTLPRTHAGISSTHRKGDFQQPSYSRNKIRLSLEVNDLDL